MTDAPLPALSADTVDETSTQLRHSSYSSAFDVCDTVQSFKAFVTQHPLSAMTSALHIPSVLSTVCLSLIPPRHELFTPNYIQKNAADLERRKEGCRTLACLARVCKAFTNPTLDVLWRDVPSVDVLLKVLPCLQHDPGIQHVQYVSFDAIIEMRYNS